MQLCAEYDVALFIQTSRVSRAQTFDMILGISLALLLVPLFSHWSMNTSANLFFDTHRLFCYMRSSLATQPARSLVPFLAKSATQASL